MKRYSELVDIPTFDERFEYLAFDSSVGRKTFGVDRFLNQRLYRSREWRDIRNFVIERDGGFDLALSGHLIFSDVHVHHMNPITVEDIEEDIEIVFNPEFLITTSRATHTALHFGRRRKPFVVSERKPGDTTLW